MANVTFFIGNGFDLQMGLETKYVDFYKEYTKVLSSDNKLLKWFKEKILRDEASGWVNWADFEKEMGRQSELFVGEHPVEDFIQCFNDFSICFNEYLVNQSSKIDWSAIDSSVYQHFNQSIRFFYNYIASAPQSVVRDRITMRSLSDAKVHFLQFNYTDIFDRLLSECDLPTVFLKLPAGQRYEINKLGVNLHIHGQMDNGYPTIGVNDKSQIVNELIRNSPHVQKIFIKPIYLDALQNRNVNQPIPRTEATDVIAVSDVICVFGASIGDTDKYWWEIIGDWLKSSGKLLIIFDVCSRVDDGISPIAFLNNETTDYDRRVDILDRFIRLADWSEEDIGINREKIIIELNSGIFNFRLPMIPL